MPEERFGFFVFLPAIAMRDKKLSQTAKLVLAEVFSLSDENGICFPSNKHLGEMVGGISETSVSLALKELKNAKWVDLFLDKKRGNQRVIHIRLDPLSENLKRSLKKLKDPSLRKLKDSNTYIRNTSRNNIVKNFESLGEIVDKWRKPHYA